MLRLRDVKALWTPSGDLGAISTAENRWLLPNNTLSANLSAIPTTAWHTIAVDGADAACIQAAFEITVVTLGGATTVTNAIPRFFGFGLPHVAAAPHDQPPGIEAAQTRSTPPGGPLAAAPLAFIWPGTDGLFGYNANDNTNMGDGFFGLISDATAPAVGETTLNTVWLSHPFANAAIGAAGWAADQPPGIEGLDRIWLAMGLSPVLAVSNITAITLTGSVRLLLFDEVVRVFMTNPRETPPYRQVNVPAS